MIEPLYSLFNDIELSWIDSYAEIDNTNEFAKLLSIFPNLENIFREGKDKDKDEFQRTIRHIFRLFKIFFLVKSGDNFHETLSEDSSTIIRERLINQNSQKELVMPIILMYHDIGRLTNKKDHPYYSYHLISTMNLLEPFKLSDIEKMLINKVIQYHLLFATIYTGESTFYGIYSLLNDTELNKLLTNKEHVSKFIDLLEIFTYIDILGYSYARIYDHYVNYYDEINIKLKSILNLWPNKQEALKKAKEYSQDWLEWRIAGALRIFQYVDTEPYLTKDFYFEKIKNSSNTEIKGMIDGHDWDTIKKNHLVSTSKIQMKYGLAILMLLGFGKFFRGPIRRDEKISNNLITFWVLLSKEIAERSIKNKEFLWNVHFIGLPNWWKWDRRFKKELNYHSLDDIIKNATQDFDNHKKELNLYLDFASIFH